MPSAMSTDPRDRVSGQVNRVTRMDSTGAQPREWMRWHMEVGTPLNTTGTIPATVMRWIRRGKHNNKQESED